MTSKSPSVFELLDREGNNNENMEFDYYISAWLL